ncbi:MAG: radical SAM protein [Candidatus Omnitrophica bacterium]|nr:radical SAM protein [Candidatus Omnitrophota bacterium]
MKILAINPWIYDFAAYDFWLKPYGFLVLLSYLQKNGFEIDYIDCLKQIAPGKFGRGKYQSQIIKKPQILKLIPRYFKRYGISIEQLQTQLQNKNPQLILITSSMTYWYPAIVDLTKILKKRFPSVPIVLGGTYATLLPQHAKETTFCDYFFTNYNLKDFFKLLNIDYQPYELFSTLPKYENFYSEFNYVVLRTSWGCPFSCSYCAIKKLATYSLRIPIKTILDFVIEYSKKTKEFVLYDDAFLYEQEYVKNFLSNIADLNLNINFHTPNALHLRFLNQEIAYLLKKTNFINPHFGLETLNPTLQKIWGDKVNQTDIIRAIKFLKNAGYKDGEFSFYLLLGYPQQNLEELKKEIEFLHSLGAKVSLAEFSPVPETEIFQEYKEILKEPLLHNNSIFYFFNQNIDDLWEIKNYARELNKKFSN